MSLPPQFLSVRLTHRALHDKADGRSENSMSAIKAAVVAGYGIEIDVQPSSDGQAMVFHDEELDRLTDDSGPIRNRSAAELGGIALKNGGGTIPTLKEVLQAIDGQVPLLIEIKDQTGQMARSDGTLETAVARDLGGYAGPVAVMSFNPHSVAMMSDLAPRVPRGLTTSAYDPDDWAPLSPETCDHLRTIPDYDRTGSCFISHEAADLRRDRVLELKKSGAAILCWTIRSPEQEALARKVADNVTFEGYLP